MLWVITEEGKSRIVGRQLRDVFDLNVFTPVSWWRISFDGFLEQIVELGSLNFSLSVFVHLQGQFHGFKDPLFF